jgi:hypothetical protein
VAAWFGPKRYGWGLTPVSWQGWLLTAVYVAGVIVLAVTLAATQIWLYLAVLAIATAVFITVAYLTRG